MRNIKKVFEKSNSADRAQLKIIGSQQETIRLQQRTIEQLMKALCSKYEHGLFVFSEDGKIPTVIRNGKELTNNLTTSFSIDWSHGEFPDIKFSQIGGTCHEWIGDK